MQAQGRVQTMDVVRRNGCFNPKGLVPRHFRDRTRKRARHEAIEVSTVLERAVQEVEGG